MAFCPLIKTECKEDECAWWIEYEEENCCAITALVTATNSIADDVWKIEDEASEIMRTAYNLDRE